MDVLINGVTRHCDYPANAHAIFALRNELDLKGVRMGCSEGNCGGDETTEEHQVFHCLSMPSV